MNSIGNEIKLEKLKNNTKRFSYLKMVSIICMCIDFLTYITFEAIQFTFDEMNEQSILICFIIKLLIFISVCSMILISILYNKSNMLLVNAIVYLVFGLVLFFYLIINEITINSSSSDSEVKPADTKSPIYYTVFINVIISLTIVSGIFRLLGSIFMLILVKIMKKIDLSKKHY
jgi:hypothetical protein